MAKSNFKMQNESSVPKTTIYENFQELSLVTRSRNLYKKKRGNSKKIAGILVFLAQILK